MIRRLLLGSDGLGALPAFLGGDVHGLSAAFVVTPSIPFEDRSYVEGDRRKLEAFGLRVQPVDVGQCPFEEALRIVRGSDLIFVTGGDVFYLMSKALESGFDRLLRERIEDGTPYVGMSAGGILVGPSLAPVDSWWPPESPRYGLSSMDGLSLVDFVILPHAGPDREERYRRVIEGFGSSLTLVPLTDQQAVVVEGDGRWIVDSP